MLQRVQSIWLFLAALCAFASLKFPFFTGMKLLPDHTYNNLVGTSNLYLMAVTIAIGVIALITIFLYANRRLQFRLCLLGIILEACLIFIYYKMSSKYSEGTYALSAALQVFVLMFFALAAKGIKNDDKIVRESNRLR
ncbi:MAG: DUF4293 domain-containing protein [Ferruginibacter sp.]